NQPQRHANENSRDSEAASQRRHEPLVTLPVMSQQNDERQLGQFGRLKTLMRDFKPATRAAALEPDSRNQHRHEQRQCDEEQWNRDFLEMTIIHASDYARRDETQTAPDDLRGRITRARRAHAGAVK